jgi:hypothetical protein
MPGTLTHSPAEITRYLIINLGLGVLPSAGGNWPVFTSQEPSLPDNVITTFDIIGVHQGRTQYDGEVQERHGVVIRVRSITHQIGYTKARAITVALDESAYQETIDISPNSYLVHAISRASGPIALGKQIPDTKRDIFTTNITVSVRQVT